jgi:hypothetical protein
MTYPFLSDAWFAELDALVAAAGDLQVPAAMKAVEINVTITAPTGDTLAYVKDGLLYRGHREGAPTSLRLGADLARKIFVEADTAAGIQAFLAGEMIAEGDLAKLVAMQMEEPSAPQRQLAAALARITQRP